MTGPINKAIQVLRTDGFEVLRGKVGKRYRGLRGRSQYQKWIRRCEAHTDADLAAARHISSKFKISPRLSILMPVYNSDERYLRSAIDSVKSQVYDSWELCIADDHSTDPHVRTILAEYAASDTRIKVAIRDSNGHISAASNTALELVSGDFCALMDHDDEISPLALYFIAKEINENPQAQIIYSDEDKLDERGSRSDPFFKPDWNPELLLGVNYINHLTVYRTDVLRGCGAFRLGYEGSQDYDLLLRATENCPPDAIRHIPRILYHWRAIAGSVAYASDEKPYAHDRARVAIREHLKRRNIDATVSRGMGQLHRVKYGISSPKPKVTVILHGEGGSAVEHLLQMAGDIPREIKTISNYTARNADIDECSAVEDQNECSILNLSANEAIGSILCFLNLRINEGSSDWLETLVGHAMQSETGAVGPMIYDKKKRIVNAGFLLGVDEGIVSAFHKAPLKPRGRSIRLDLPQNVLAVSVDCLVIGKDKFLRVNGFDERFGKESACVDLCLRLAEEGQRTVWTPHAELRSSDDSDGPTISELNELRTRWPSFFNADPYYNPNLSRKMTDYSLGSTCVLGKY